MPIKSREKQNLRHKDETYNGIEDLRPDIIICKFATHSQKKAQTSKSNHLCDFCLLLLVVNKIHIPIYFPLLHGLVCEVQ